MPLIDFHTKVGKIKHIKYLCNMYFSAYTCVIVEKSNLFLSPQQ